MARVTAVAVTGYAALSPQGSLATETSRPLDDGAPPGAAIQRFNAARFPIQRAAEVLFASETEMATEVVRLAIGEGRAVCAHHRSERIGVFLGAEPLRPLGFCEHRRRVDRSPERLTRVVADIVGAKGPTRTFSMACVASAVAIAAAVRAVRAGDVTLALAGGVAINVEPLLFAGFCHLKTMSPTGVCRPFDAARDGFILADGAGILVLESGARVRETGREGERRATLLGVGESMDAYRITDPHPEGRGACQAIAQALEDAGVTPGEVALVKAHATGTAKNDAVEAQVIHDMFGARTAVLALKGRLGHGIAASGAVEAAYAIDALARGIVPGVGTLAHFDETLPPIRVANEAQRVEGSVAVLNTFGFGGLNAALVLAV